MTFDDLMAFSQDYILKDDKMEYELKILIFVKTFHQLTANKKETYSPKSLILILFVALLPSANCNIFFHCYHLQISHEYKARPSLDNKRKQGIGFFHENLIIISKMLCHHTLMINSIFTYSTT